MLHLFPWEAPYLEAGDLDTESSSVEEALDRLSRLLPLLGDELVPVWSSEPLPFQPVALVSFRDKTTDELLVATVCESGLLALLAADDPRSITYLQIPDIWQRHGVIHALWASRAIRPFGPWTELWIVVAISETTEQFRLYRALARAQKNDGALALQLEPAREDQDASTFWASTTFPNEFEWLTRGQLTTSLGADPLDIETAKLIQAEIGEEVLLCAAPKRVFGVANMEKLVDSSVSEKGKSQVWPVEGQIVGPVPLSSLYAARPSGLLVWSRHLVAMEYNNENQPAPWHQVWEQPLRHRILAIASLDTPTAEYPDLLVASGARELVRFRYVGSAELERQWASTVEGLFRLRGQRTTLEKIKWCHSLLAEGNPDLRLAKAQQRALIYVAVQLALENRADWAEKSLGETLSQFLADPRDPELMIPAAHLLVRALEAWEQELIGDGLMALLWNSYSHKPFRFQEIFDAHLRRLEPEAREKLTKLETGGSFQELARASADSLAFFEPKDDSRKAGIICLRNILRYVPAAFGQLSSKNKTRRRHLAPLLRKGQPTSFVAFHSRGLECFELKETATALELVKFSELSWPHECTFYVRTVFQSESIFFLANRMEEVAVWRQGQEVSEFCKLRLPEDENGRMTAISVVANRLDLDLFVVFSSKGKANIHRFALVFDVPGSPTLRWRANWSTELRRVASLEVFAIPGGFRAFCSEAGDGVVVDLLPGNPRAELAGRRHFGSSVVGLTVLHSNSEEITDKAPLGLAYLTRSGQVFAIDADTSKPPWLRVRWIQNVPTGCLSVVAGFSNTERCGAIGAGGSLHLFDRNGRRLAQWEPADPAAAAIFLPPRRTKGNAEDGLVVVAHDSGALTVLRSEFEELPAPPGNEESGLEDRRTETWEAGQVYRRYEHRDPLDRIYREARFPIGKLVLCRLCYQSPRSDKRPGEWQTLVDVASARELAALLEGFSKNPPSLGANEQEQLISEVLRRLTRDIEGEPAGGGDRHLRMDDANLLDALLHFGRCAGRQLAKEPALQKLARGLYDHDSVPHLLAFAILEALRAEEHNPGSLLLRLLMRLARFPASVTRAMVTLTGGGSRGKNLENTLRNIDQFASLIAYQARSEEKLLVVTHISGSLEEWRNDDSLLGFLARLCNFIADRHLSEAPAHRFERVRALVSDSSQMPDTGSFFRSLVEPVRRWFPRQPPPRWGSLKDWATWIVDCQQRLLSQQGQRENLQDQLDKIDPVHSEWRSLLNAIAELGSESLQEILDSLGVELQKQTRALLHVRRVQRLPNGDVQLRFAVFLESLRQRSRVQWSVRIEGLGGLQAKELATEFMTLSVSPGQPSQLQEFSAQGQVMSRQKEIFVLLQTPTWEDQVPIPLPPLASAFASTEHFPLDELPEWVAFVANQVKIMKKKPVLILVDEDLGRTTLVDACLPGGGRLVELDTRLADFGPGRKWHKQLTPSTLVAALLERPLPYLETQATALPAITEALLVTECDDLVMRLLTEVELMPTANALVELLSARRRDLAHRLVLNRALGLRLYQRLPGRFVLLDGHRLPEEELGKESLRPGRRGKKLSLLNQVAAGLRRVTGCESLTPTVLRLLGGDLSAAWLVAMKSKQADTPLPADQSLFDDPALLELLTRLTSWLSPEEQMALMLAAIDTTTIRLNQAVVGMVAVQTVHSGHSSAPLPKTLVEAGERINPRAKRALNANAQARERTLEVEGIEESRDRTHLIPALASILPERGLIPALQRLVEMNLVERAGSVFRVRLPLAGWIRRRVAVGASVQEVYAELSGGRQALDLLPLQEFGRLSPQSLQAIHPGLDLGMATALGWFGQAWSNYLEGREISQSDVARALSRLFRAPVTQLARGRSSATSGYEGLLEDERDLLFGVHLEGANTFRRLVAFLAGSKSEPTTQLQALCSQRGEESGKLDQLIVFTLGRRASRTSLSCGAAFLDGDTLRSICLHSRWNESLAGTVRKYLGLKSLSPFITAGALPPGSALFFGRTTELERMRTQIRERSFLIVGSRQIGKTSLLNRLRFELRNRDDLSLYFFDLQLGFPALIRSLQDCLDKNGLDRGTNPVEHFRQVIDSDHSRGRLSVFLLNEVDDLLERHSDLLRALRGFHDEGRARFCMTGFLRVAKACRDLYSPFYHWTSVENNVPYILLAELEDHAACEIIDVLEHEPLALAWESADEKHLAVEKLLQRSYRIPALLQSFCHALVERGASYRSNGLLRASDVLTLAEQENFSAWRWVAKIRWDQFLGAQRNAARADLSGLANILLLAAAKKLYFTGPLPLIQHGIHFMDPKGVTFANGELRSWTLEATKPLLSRPEFSKLRSLLDSLEIADFLHDLSLTFLISSVPSDLGEESYFFQSHLYPLEIQRLLRPGEVIDDLIIRNTVKLHTVLT